MHSFNRLISTLWRCGSKFRQKKFEGTDICAPDVPYLFYLCHRENVSQDEMIKELFVSKSHATRRLAHLEEVGYIVRETSKKDKRALLVTPTERVKEVIPLLLSTAKEWGNLITKDFSPEEEETFFTLLERAVENAKTAVLEDEDE